jgi:hypothetical protein
LPTPFDLAHDQHGHGCFAIDLDGEVQGYVVSIRDRLIERGVLRKDGDNIWRLAWHGFDLDKERAADMSCCDFCSERPVCWLVPCESFAMPKLLAGMPPSTSVGDWAACHECGEYINQRKKAALLGRCLEPNARELQHLDLDGLPAELQRSFRRVQRQMKTELHQRFWRHYQGGAVRVTPHPFGH